jgi:hypothetical protein
MIWARSSWFSIIRSNHLRRILGALLGRFGGPRRHRLVGGGDGLGDVAAPELGHVGDGLAACRIGDREGLRRADPLSVDVALVLEQRLVGQAVD